MPKVIKPLTDTRCTTAKPQEKDYTLFDGGGLHLLIKKSGAKVWRYKFKRPSGKSGLMTFGNYPALTLSAARDKRRDCERLLAEGIDPIDDKNKKQAQANNQLSFEAVARAWHTAYLKTGKWHEETAARALREFENHVFPVIGCLTIDDINPPNLNKLLIKIEQKNIYEVLKKTRQRLVHIFDYAIRQGYITHNPANNLKGSTATKKAKHYPALPLKQLPDFFDRLESVNVTPLVRLCMLINLHVFVRASEIRFARWSEFNIDFTQPPVYEGRVWEIPPVREPIKGAKYSGRGAKMKTAHLVPLSRQVIDLLYQLYDVSGYTFNLFPHRCDPKLFISENTINKTLRRMGYNTETDVCGHGFRSMAYAALRECKLFDRDAVEMQMSHTERNDVTAAYSHTIAFIEERREMVNWWSDYLTACRDKFITPYEFGWLNR